jgi:orotidine-5'-phosphate decarboxylase
LNLLDFKQPWVPRIFQTRVVSRLFQLGLIEIDNAFNLPTSNDQTTDIYINLRNARNRPEAIKYLVELYREPIYRLKVTKFVEVPDSVSCIAGPLCLDLNMPYLTIRKDAKEGRVADPRVIGNSIQGESVCIIDDVITTGKSIGLPIEACLRKKLNIRGVIVLVNRNPSHKPTNVWAGMTLHDVRRILINMGMMRKCDIQTEKKNKLIIALDNLSWLKALPFLERIRTLGCILKVNDWLIDDGADNLLPELSVYGRVMIDLKNHDIPNTVYNTCKRLARHNPWAVTIHASGGPDMIKAAARGLSGTDTKLFAVTVPTSLDDNDCSNIYSRKSIEAVRKLAFLAHISGINGFVCSAHEISEIKSLFPSKEFTFVTPGIRSEGIPTNDQARTATPKSALENGANYVVIGRQILENADPVAEVKRILSEEL